MVRPAEVAPLYFFLSYAGADTEAEDDLVVRLFEDLSNEIRQLIPGRKNTTVGFLDNLSLTAGLHWPTALVSELARCQTFVALCSPPYFGREACGREWTYFRDRLAAYRIAAGRPAPSLIPLQWVVFPMPPIVRDLQYRDRSFGPVYARHGLRYLLRISSHEDEYREFVSALAKIIIRMVDQHRIPHGPEDVDFHTIANAFGGPPLDPADPPIVVQPTDDVARQRPDAAADRGEDAPARPGIPKPRSRPILNPNDTGAGESGSGVQPREGAQ